MPSNVSEQVDGGEGGLRLKAGLKDCNALSKNVPISTNR